MPDARNERPVKYDLQTLRGDFFGGITSAVIALPVSLAFGVASGLGAASGLYGAIAVGFFAAVCGGNRFQISGPTPAMTVAMAVIVTTHASTLGEAFTVVVLAGLLQITLGLLKTGRFVVYTPYAVISGFMSGIGVIVMLIQILPLLGAPTATGGPMDAVRALPDAVANLNGSALVIGVATLAVSIFWPRRLSRLLPGPLVALVAGTALGLFWLTDVPIIGAIPSGLPELQLTLPSASFLARAFHPAIILALLGSVDSLLTSLIADSLTGTRHKPNRELIGQGLGNMVAGLFGGLPGAGATMGTVTSIRAGGRSPLAGALAAVLLLALLLGFGWIAEPIPHAVLAGILIKVGWDIIDWRFVVRLRAIRREYVLVMLLTFLVTVFVDLVTAVALGLIATGVVRSMDRTRTELDSVLSVPLLDRAFVPDVADIDPYRLPVGLVRLKGRFSVGSANELTRAIHADIEDHDIVILDFSETTDVDDSAALAIEELVESALDEGTACIVMGLGGEVARVLHSLVVFRHVPAGHFVDGLDEAKRLAGHLLGGGGAIAPV